MGVTMLSMHHHVVPLRQSLPLLRLGSLFLHYCFSLDSKWKGYLFHFGRFFVKILFIYLSLIFVLFLIITSFNQCWYINIKHSIEPFVCFKRGNFKSTPTQKLTKRSHRGVVGLIHGGDFINKEHK
jgi:hypothetical protein